MGAMPQDAKLKTNTARTSACVDKLLQWEQFVIAHKTYSWLLDCIDYHNLLAA